MYHTPGPWSINYTKIESVITHWHIVGKKWGSVYPICTHTIEVEPSATEQYYNGKLLALAPDMYEALVQIAEIYENTSNETATQRLYGARCVARMVLAKLEDE